MNNVTAAFRYSDNPAEFQFISLCVSAQEKWLVFLFWNSKAQVFSPGILKYIPVHNKQEEQKCSKTIVNSVKD